MTGEEVYKKLLSDAVDMLGEAESRILDCADDGSEEDRESARFFAKRVDGWLHGLYRAGGLHATRQDFMRHRAIFFSVKDVQASGEKLGLTLTEDQADKVLRLMTEPMHDRDNRVMVMAQILDHWPAILALMAEPDSDRQEDE